MENKEIVENRKTIRECKREVEKVLKKHGVVLYSDYTEGWSGLIWSKGDVEIVEETD